MLHSRFLLFLLSQSKLKTIFKFIPITMHLLCEFLSTCYFDFKWHETILFYFRLKQWLNDCENTNCERILNLSRNIDLSIQVFFWLSNWERSCVVWDCDVSSEGPEFDPQLHQHFFLQYNESVIEQWLVWNIYICQHQLHSSPGLF